MPFDRNLKKAGVSDEVIHQIVDATYLKSQNEKQNCANFYAAAITKCNELLDFDTLAEAMFDRACCKSGFRLNNARMIAKEHSDKSLEDKLDLLGQQKWMGHPHLTENGDIYTEYCAGSGTPDHMKCSCQKALGLKLRVKEIVSSVFGKPSQYCSFLFEIVGSTSE